MHAACVKIRLNSYLRSFQNTGKRSIFTSSFGQPTDKGFSASGECGCLPLTSWPGVRPMDFDGAVQPIAPRSLVRHSSRASHTNNPMFGWIQQTLSSSLLWALVMTYSAEDVLRPLGCCARGQLMRSPSFRNVYVRSVVGRRIAVNVCGVSST